ENLHALGGWAALLAVVVIAAVTVPLPALAGAGESRALPTSPAAVTEAGRSLYRAQCASCHGQQGEGTDYGPSLVGAGAAAADFYLRTGRMPLSAPGQPVARHVPILRDEEIRALVEVVASFGEGPGIPQVAGGGDVGEGARLYIANCAACHGASMSGNAIGGGSRAFGLGLADPVQIVEAMRIGPGAMPRFGFSEDEEAAIVAYIEEQRRTPAPGGLAIGGLGAVAEGFIAVGLGLVLLVLAAMFVGRRSHGGEPPDARLP
ncbi:MAG: c-type cytochrome, partial [Chloroflexi bacterium]|nr:c-type cytochrome [Chloroflexota bacterium]